MPELPEVEASRELLQEYCVGRKIVKVQAVEDEKVFDGSSAKDLLDALTDRTFRGVKRRGKHLWWLLDGDGQMPLMHFGMTGSVKVKDTEGNIQQLAYENSKPDTSWPPKFHKVVLDLSDGTAVAFSDARRFARFKLVDGDPGTSSTITQLGFDPLLDMPGQDEFEQLVRKRAKGATRLKPLLLDQTFSAGVGNWVADEVLYHAHLHPEQLVVDLEPSHLQQLRQALLDVVTQAVQVKADADKFPEDWLFRHRWGKKAGSVGGHKIDHITVGGRTSAYIPAVQKLIVGSSGAAATAKGSKPKQKGKKRKAASGSESDGGGSSQDGRDLQASPAAAGEAKPAPAAKRATKGTKKGTAVSKRRPGKAG